ncbi:MULTISPECIES: hypothetical protein [Amycolatopsis]|nr:MULTISPECIES: hypothetical protein [Amycolatopsis]
MLLRIFGAYQSLVNIFSLVRGGIVICGQCRLGLLEADRMAG